MRTPPVEVKAGAPEVPWVSIDGLRNMVVHDYFRVDAAVVDRVLAALAHAVRSRLLDIP